MKSALSLVMIVCLVGSALPAGAEDGPLAKAAEREAVRLAAAKAQPSPTSTAVLEFPTGPGTPLELKWNELAPLIAGERVEVTGRAAQKVGHSPLRK